MPPETDPHNQEAPPSEASPAERVSSTAREPKPAMRTMRSDMEGMFYANKPPALIQFMHQGREDTPLQTNGLLLNQHKTRKRSFLIPLIVILTLGAGVVVGFFFFPQLAAKIPGLRHVVSPNAPIPRQPAVIPMPFFATEGTEELAAPAGDRVILLELLDNLAKKSGRQGTIKRVLIKLTDERGEYYASLADLFDVERITPPPRFLDNTEGPLMTFFAATAEGERFGLVVRVTDSDRALQDLRVWETALGTNFQPLMFSSELTATTTSFTSGTYRNIDWRFLKRSVDQDLGVGYALFPARNYIILITSMRALETVIDRLFNAR
ncbi:MAG: hypothetical protein Q8Q94_00025 [bacterium]|nr:hypothetical protein [bacterium]MDZ4299284.1 hypothetical protein [Candidatus Sungbacteria bacterium]